MCIMEFTPHLFIAYVVLILSSLYIAYKIFYFTRKKKIVGEYRTLLQYYALMSIMLDGLLKRELNRERSNYMERVFKSNSANIGFKLNSNHDMIRFMSNMHYYYESIQDDPFEMCDNNVKPIKNMKKIIDQLAEVLNFLED